MGKERDKQLFIKERQPQGGFERLKKVDLKERPELKNLAREFEEEYLQSGWRIEDFLIKDNRQMIMVFKQPDERKVSGEPPWEGLLKDEESDLEIRGKVVKLDSESMSGWFEGTNYLPESIEIGYNRVKKEDEPKGEWFYQHGVAVAWMEVRSIDELIERTEKDIGHWRRRLKNGRKEVVVLENRKSWLRMRKVEVENEWQPENEK